MRHKEERKYKNVKTTEILDFVAQDIPYDKDKERDKQTDYRDELEQREPFSDIKGKIERIDRDMKDMKDAIAKLLNHKHDEQGGVTIPVKNTIQERYL